MELRRFLVILTIVLIAILVVVVWLLPSNEDFRNDNPFWNGAKLMSENYSALPLDSLADLPASPQGSTLILVPYLSFTAAEFEELSHFIKQGGTLILADDYGFGNQLLEYLGLEVRFAGQALLDPLLNYRNKWFPKISRFESSRLTDNIETLVLNHATSLINVEADKVIALSSPFSFLDLDNNLVRQTDEPVGPLPVISQHKMGKGQLILVADPSLFINSMEPMESNNIFIQNIAAVTTSSLYIDQSHLPTSDLSRTKILLADIRGYLVTPLGTTGLVLLALAIALKPIWHKRDSKRS